VGNVGEICKHGAEFSADNFLF